MNPLAKKLSDLKLSLQELESAVQQPRDEMESVLLVLGHFPVVMRRFHEIFRDVLSMQGVNARSAEQAFTEAHNRGWVKGDFSLWLRLVSDFQEIERGEIPEASARSVAQDVRACSCLFWETFEILTARFRYQTQAQPVQKSLSATAVNRLSLQSI